MTPNKPLSRHSRVGRNPAKKPIPRSGQNSGFRIRDSGFGIAPRCVQRGFSLISAIFLLVVIAALGMFAVTLSTGQQQSAALDVMGSRAYQASRAGIEWGTYWVIASGIISCNTLPSTTPNTVVLAAPDLQNFSVTVDCGSKTDSESGVPVTVYQLTSTATQGTVATPNYVERQITATIAR